MRWLLGLLFVAVSSNAWADELELGFGGRIQSNIRFRTENKSIGEWYGERRLTTGIARNEHILKAKANATYGRFTGVMEVDFVWLGFSPDANTFASLSQREDLEHTRFEAQSAYVEALDLLPGLDFRLGQMITNFGVGDQFNPTNNLNADDVEDRLLFGAQQANLMARVDYTLEDWFTLSGILVPVFRPALLPSSAELGAAAVDRLPHLDDQLRYRIHSEAAAAINEGFPTIIRELEIALPKTSMKNMQGMARLSTSIFEQDIALSYYKGFDDFPLPTQNTARQITEMRCRDEAMTDCIDGLIETTAVLSYPRIQVGGLNMTGEIPFFGSSLGYRFELGVYFPSPVRIRMFQDNVSIAGQTLDGEYDYGIDDDPPLVLDGTPYAKWTLGLDYTFNEHVYLNVQWVHGFADEAGSGDFISSGKRVRTGGISAGVNPIDDCINPLGPTPERCATEIRRNTLGDYLVLGLDLRFLSGDLLLRMFTILELTGYTMERFSMSAGERISEYKHAFSSDGLSMVLFPEVNYNFGGGFELGAGALLFLGKDHTKFGDPAAGGSIIWTRGRFSF